MSNAVRGEVSAGTSRSMRSNRRRDTRPELAVRSELHRRGLRFRVDYAPLTERPRRRADIVFTRKHVAVFVDGCFWHGCPIHATYPKSNTGYWLPKLARNIERDRETDAELKDRGWRVVRVWEHMPPADAADMIEEALTKASGHSR
ncbi:very short patch repair endonuclease [Kocuria coralli]|uniref:Very short patch repair endonuclease n=1 Tax=Kocuria coralli TaxID=1461025 RepID=A0A5J5KU19_9MICC|nr:very short patch repair endonuclease [Kocuria coralli]KAA9393012.1 very short patch repair endonuclease [Kocuria coralli]